LQKQQKKRRKEMSAINGFAIFGRLLQLDAKKPVEALKSFVMLEITFAFFMEIQKLDGYFICKQLLLS